MRLICPNCGAQYEVAIDVIPTDGRDVQCSSCGHTWFESPMAPSAALEDPSAPSAVPEDKPIDALASNVDPAPSPEEPQATEEQTAPAEPPRNPPRKQLDPSIADILREEAAREEAARRSEASTGLEQQGDLGLTDPAPTPPPPPSRKVESGVGKGAAQPIVDQRRTGSPTSSVKSSRREMFPDIEKINSTLRSSAERDALPPLPHEAAQRDRRSGRRGFFMMLALIVLAAMLYVFATDIAAALPALSDPLASYVETVDSARLWLDAQVQSMLGDGPAERN